MEKSNFLQPNQATTTLGIPNTPSHSKKKEGIASIFEYEDIDRNLFLN